MVHSVMLVKVSVSHILRGVMTYVTIYSYLLSVIERSSDSE